MKNLLCRSLPRWTFTLLGLALAVIAIAAYPLGLDNNPAMGPRRVALLAFGLAVTLLAQEGAIRKKLGLRAPSSEAPAVLGQAPRPMGLRLWLPLSLLALAIAVFYAWLVTGGNPAAPPATTNYYDMLAEAFAAGQTHLKAVPDPRLAVLSNPYDPAQHRAIPRCGQGQTTDCLLFDASYHEGKYYLYWGPAPAALFLPLKAAGVSAVSDAGFALLGACLLFGLTAAFLVLAWRRFFAHLPIWLLFPPVLLAALAYPLPWVLDGPRIYEAAILYGAAFLMGGLVAAFPILTGGTAGPGRMLAVGIFWGLAFGTRAALLFPIAALTLALAWMVWRRPGLSTPASRGRWIAALVTPVLTAGALIAGYNFVRFSSPFEFGWRFALGAPAGQAEGTLAAFRLGNIPINLYHYALAPAALVPEAPFLRPLLAGPSVGPIASPQPELFYGELVTGLLYTTPFLLFALFLLWWLPCKSSGADEGFRQDEGRPASTKALKSTILFLMLGCLAGAIPLLSIYAVTARYLLDLSPVLLVVAGLGAWIAYAEAGTRSARILVGGAILATALASAGISSLLAFNNWLT